MPNGNEIKGGIHSIIGLATAASLIAVENEIPSGIMIMTMIRK